VPTLRAGHNHLRLEDLRARQAPRRAAPRAQGGGGDEYKLSPVAPHTSKAPSCVWVSSNPCETINWNKVIYIILLVSQALAFSHATACTALRRGHTGQPARLRVAGDERRARAARAKPRHLRPAGVLREQHLGSRLGTDCLADERMGMGMGLATDASLWYSCPAALQAPPTHGDMRTYTTLITAACVRIRIRY
jgi:hypothetical protein